MHLYLKSFFITLTIGVFTSFLLWGNDYKSVNIEFTTQTSFSDQQTFTQYIQFESIPNNNPNTSEENETNGKDLKKNSAHFSKTFLYANFKNYFDSSLLYTKSNFSTLKRIPLFLLFSCWKIDMV